MCASLDINFRYILYTFLCNMFFSSVLSFVSSCPTPLLSLDISLDIFLVYLVLWFILNVCFLSSYDFIVFPFGFRWAWTLPYSIMIPLLSLCRLAHISGSANWACPEWSSLSAPSPAMVLCTFVSIVCGIPCLNLLAYLWLILH